MLTHKTGAVCISLLLLTSCYCLLLHTLKEMLAFEKKENHYAIDYILTPCVVQESLCCIRVILKEKVNSSLYSGD